VTGPLIDAAAHLADDAGYLGVLLAQWGYRDDPGTRDQAAAVRAGNSALDTIDAMVRTLYAARAVLAGEIRAGQDETAARGGAMLAAGRDGAR
jgi:hypothetical protein